MSIRNRPTEKMSNLSFKGMLFIFNIIDLFFPYIKRRIKKFGITREMTIVDYGCGPGRYSIPLAEIVGEKGKIYAVDIHELALDKVKEKIKKKNIKNIELIHAQGNDDGGYACKLPDNTADVICVLDMFFIIKKPALFLKEIKRLLKPDGVLIIDDGHQSRMKTKEKISDSNLFEIFEETKDHLKCRLI